MSAFTPVIGTYRPYFAAKLRYSVAHDSVVVAGTGGLIAGTVQAALQLLATRVQALEDA